jgi:pimeloyl-ACP methyl ester carboxylesterase
MPPFLRPIARTITLLSLVVSVSSAAVGDEVPLGQDRPIPKSVMTVGTMRVETYGGGSPALVFIPGLDCGSWVWDSAVRLYESTHAVYVVTLAGFDGIPAPAKPTIDGADASLLELLTKHGIHRPVLIGHSLGGFLALRFGSEHSNLLRGIVAVDGTPVFIPLLTTTPEQRLKFGDAFVAQLSAISAQEFSAGQLDVISKMVTDPTKAAQVAALTGKSDAKATGAYARDLYVADLRPQLKNLTAPTLEIASVPTKPAPYEGPQAASESQSERSAWYQRFYQSLFPGAPDVQVVTIPNSLHFVMIDQPTLFYDAITHFIGTLQG